MTGILISVKRRKTKGTVVNYEIDEKAINFFPRSESPEASRRPYIGLVMELGIQPLSSASTPKPTKGKGKKRTTTRTVPGPSKPRSTQPKTQQTPSKVRILGPGQIHHPSSEHPRYSIFAYGCSNTVYKGITPHNGKSISSCWLHEIFLRRIHDRMMRWCHYFDG